MCTGCSEIDGLAGRRQTSVASVVLCHVSAMFIYAGVQSRHTFQAYICIWILLHRLEIVFVFVLVRWLDNVAIRIETWRIALQNVPAVAGVLNALYLVSLCYSRGSAMWRRTFLYGRGSERKSGSLARAYCDLRFRSCL